MPNAKAGFLITEEGHPPDPARKAMIAAASTGLRPILMTSGATVACHFPLVLVGGAGSAARNSIGLVLVRGMAVETPFHPFTRVVQARGGQRV